MTAPAQPAADPTTRFSDRVTDYLKYRPRYPAELVALIAGEARLAPCIPVADLGSGTGFLAQCFLEAGHPVTGVEPNGPMRAAAEELLADYPGFISVDGTAEATGLPEGAFGLVTAGQAFHWFDPEKTRAEVRRILAPAGWMAVVWNRRDPSLSPLLGAYNALLQAHVAEYEKTHHHALVPQDYDGFFGGGRWRRLTLSNAQHFDWEGLQGRLRSSSYCPPPDDPRHGPLMDGLRTLFDQHAQGGHVRFDYTTEVYLGQV